MQVSCQAPLSLAFAEVLALLGEEPKSDTAADAPKPKEAAPIPASRNACGEDE